MASINRKKGSPHWWLYWTDGDGRRRSKSSGETNKDLAQVALAKLVDRASRRRLGVSTSLEDSLVEAAEIKLSQHFDDFVQNLKDDRRSAKHVADHVRIFKDFIECTRATRLADVGKREIVDYLERRRVERDNGARSLNRVRAVLTAAFLWFKKKGRIDQSPVDDVKRADESVDRRRVRRGLTDAEIDALFVLADQRERGTFYKLCYFAALRREEATRLTWSDLDLSAGTLTIRGSKAKGRVDVVPLVPELLDELRRVRPALVLPSARVCTSVPGFKLRRKDFEDAGINPPSTNAAGDLVERDPSAEVADLHSLRTTCGTNLARLGVAPQVAQRILRHSTVELTMRHYTKLRLDSLANGVARLGELRPSAAQRTARMAVGADQGPNAAQDARGGNVADNGGEGDIQDGEAADHWTRIGNASVQSPGAETEFGAKLSVSGNAVNSVESRDPDESKRSPTRGLKIHCPQGREGSSPSLGIPRDPRRTDDATTGHESDTPDAVPPESRDQALHRVLARLAEAWPTMSAPLRAAILALLA